MIIPIRCMNCGKMIADKWRYYQLKLRQMKGDQSELPYYMDSTTVPDTPEKKVLDELELTRPCCRKHFLTQKDLIEKI